MALRWTPDTCVGVTQGKGCRLLYRSIDGVKINLPSHYQSTEQTCSGHSGVSGVALATVVLAESRRRQITFSIAMAIDSQLQREDMSASYTDVSRVLEVSFSRVIPLLAKTQMLAAFNLQFGPKKVVILDA